MSNIMFAILINLLIKGSAATIIALQLNISVVWCIIAVVLWEIKFTPK